MSSVMTCSVCGEEAEALLLAQCSRCDEDFHLNPRSDIPGKDCGAVWINEQYMSLEYACQRCLDGSTDPATAAPPRVLRPQLGRRRYRKRN
jgi:hypothetical protein